MESGLYSELVKRRLIIPHSESDEQLDVPDSGARVIEPELIPFISYPYEWSPGQLREAALATLTIQSLAIKYGMTLRDASAYNIAFHHGQAVLLDTLSLGLVEPGQAWVAYGQFCRHFLGPLALIKHVDPRLLQLLRVHVDGIPLDLSARLLRGHGRRSIGLAMHIRAHAKLVSRATNKGWGGASPARKHRTVSTAAITGLIDSLRRMVKKLEWQPTKSAWRDYYALRESYSDAGMQAKEAAVREILESGNFQTIWDLGANAGTFSKLSAKVTKATVVAVEMDPSALEMLWRDCRAAKVDSVVPVLADLANPSPGLGWANNERDSLIDRGPADLALALALIHHIAIANNVPLPLVAEWLSDAADSVLIEWVPKEDPMVRRLLSTREDVFTNYTMEAFEEAFEPYFEVLRKVPLSGTERTLFLLKRR